MIAEPKFEIALSQGLRQDVEDKPDPAACMQFPVGNEPDRNRYWCDFGENAFDTRCPVSDILHHGPDAESLFDHLPGDSGAFRRNNDIVLRQRQTHCAQARDQAVGLFKADENDIRHVFERRRSSGPFEVFGRCVKPCRRVAQAPGDEVRLFGARMTNGNVRLAAAQVSNFVRCQYLDVDFRRNLTQPLQHIWQEIHRRDIRRRNADGSRDALRLSGGGERYVVCRFAHCADMVEKFEARLSQGERPSQSFEQRHAKPFFKRCDLPAERGLRQAERPRGSRKRTFLGCNQERSG